MIFWKRCQIEVFVVQMVQRIIKRMKFPTFKMTAVKKFKWAKEFLDPNDGRSRPGEIHQRQSDEKSAKRIITMANSVIRSGRIRDALSIYASAFCLGEVISEHLNVLVQALRENAAAKLLQRDERTYDIAVCPFCEGILVEPLTLPCGHTYCKRCLMERDQCVKCAVEFNQTQVSNIKANIVINSVLDKVWRKEVEAATLCSEGEALYLENNYEDAVTKFIQAQNLDGSDHLVHNNLSRTRLSQGNYQQALDHAQRSSDLNPNCSKSYCHKGAALENLGRLEEATVAYLQYLVMEQLDRSREQEIQKTRQHVLWREGKTKLENIHDGLDREIQTLRGVCGRQIEKPGDVNNLDRKDFECSLCIRLFWQPVTTPCGHVFCKRCLQRSLDHKAHCPLCKNSLTDYLAERRDATTEFVEAAMNKFFPVELQEREKAFEEEIKELASAGKDPEHGVPLFVCTMAYPSISCPLHIFEPRYRLMTRQCMESGTREFGMCAAVDDEADGIAKFGTILVIQDISYCPDGRSVVKGVGSRRFKVLQTSMRDGYHVGSVEFISDTPIQETEIQDVKNLHDLVYSEVSRWFSAVPDINRTRILQHFGPLPEVDASYLHSANGPRWMWWTLAILPIEVKVQIQILSIDSLKRRLEALQRVLNFVSRFGPQGATQ